MDKWQRDYIRSNLTTLVNDTNCDARFMNELFEANIIYEGDIEAINVHRNKYDKNFEFYSTIQKKLNAFPSLKDALRATNQEALAILLENVSPPGIQPPAPTEMATSSGKDPELPPTEEPVDFQNIVEPLVISVRKPKSEMAFSDDNYKLRKGFKGYALVLNITEFKDDDHNRPGAEYDTLYMTQLWSGLGYKVTQREGFFNFRQVQNILDKFLNQFREDSSAGSCVVFFGSHGEPGPKILVSDNRSVDLFGEIVYKFNSKQCPELVGKPKIFFIQACQGPHQDATAVLNKTEMMTASDMPIDDAIVCSATIPLYVAYRQYIGTWYIYCLAKVFMEEAHSTHLHGLLKRVQETMRSIKGGPTTGQLSSFTDLGIKTLYFNMPPHHPPNSTYLNNN